MKPQFVRIALIAFGMLLISVIRMPTALAYENGIGQRLIDLEAKVERIEKTLADVEETAGIAIFVLFLFGTVLAMWAQRRGDSGCLWFIFGLIPVINIFAAITALMLGERTRPPD